MTANQMIKTLSKAGFDMGLIIKESVNVISVTVRDEDDCLDWIATSEAAKKASQILGGVWWIQSGYGACILDARRRGYASDEMLLTAETV